jgi:gas vesicle protein
MNTLTAWLRNIRLDRILTAFLIGILMFVSTACNNGVQAKTADKIRTADQIREEVPSSAVTNQYKGGMNDYSDVDPRKNTTEANTKAKALVDNAKKNIDEKSVDSIDQYGRNYRSGTPLGERVKRIGEDVSDSVENVTEKVSKGTQKNLRQTQDLTEDVKDKANQTKENTKDLGYKIKRGAQDAADTVKSTVNKATDAID